MILTEEYINSLDRQIYNDVDTCLDHFASLELENSTSFWNKYTESNPLYYHVYWCGKLGDKQELCIKSYLATQNLKKSKLIIWIEPDYYTTNEINIKFNDLNEHENIIFKFYNPNKLSKETPFEGHNFINIKDDRHIKYRSDFARIMILYHYGGVYFDLDMINIFVHQTYTYITTFM